MRNKKYPGVLRSLMHYASKYYLKLFILAISLATYTILNTVHPRISAKITNHIYDGIRSKFSGGAGIDFSAINQIIFSLIILFIIIIILMFISELLTSHIAVNLSYAIYSDAAYKFKKLPLAYFDRNASGDVLSRFTNDIAQIQNSFTNIVAESIRCVIQVIGYLIMMLLISWKLSIIVILVLPVSTGLISMIFIKVEKVFKQKQETIGKLTANVEEIYSNSNIVRSFNYEKVAKKEFDEINAQLYKSDYLASFLGTISFPIADIVSNIAYILVALVGGLEVISRNLLIGDVQAFIQYTRNFNYPITQVGQIFSQFQLLKAACDRIFTFIYEEEMEDESHKQNHFEAIGNVSFKNVHFGYSKDKIIINDFSMDIKAGENIAIVGPTGAGKTTLVKLLMRFYELNGGSIMIDGVNIADLNKLALRDNIGMVLQDAWLESESILTNMRFAKADASEEEIITACKKAYCHHYIQTLEKGYETVLDVDSEMISAGQKQLITIARVFLKDPKILILDEATSSVDTRTEALIQKSMEKLMENKTSFVIAHRLSTIRNADKIIVMDQGDIVEVGNHEELLAKKGFYEKLYMSQFAED